MTPKFRFKWSKKATTQKKWGVRVFHSIYCGKLHPSSKNIEYGNIPPNNLYPCYECSHNYYNKEMMGASNGET